MTPLRALLAVLVLAGCSSDGDLQRGYAALARGLLPQRAAPAAALPLGGPVLVATRLPGGEREALTLLRRDPDGVETWAAASGARFVFADRLLIATRGIAGSEIAGSDLGALPAALAGRSEGQLTRVRRLRRPDGGQEVQGYVCDLFRDGAAMREACASPGLRFEGGYAFDDLGAIRSSRQWVGGELGLMQFDWPSPGAPVHPPGRSR